MKDNYLLFLFLIISNHITYSQITNSNNLEIGESYNYHYGFIDTTFNVGNSGQNEIWDFSDIPEGTGTMSNVLPPNNSIFPEANIRILDTVGLESHYLVTDSSYSYFGGYDGFAEIIYENPEDWFRYPMEYLSSFEDSFSGTYEALNILVNREGNTSVIVDGIGTLITPAGMIENVLRVHTELNFTHTHSNGFVQSYLQEGYTWWNMESGYASFAFAKITDLSGSVPSVASYLYLDDISTSITSLPKTKATLNISPNPTASSISISYEIGVNDYISLSIYNLLGQEVVKIHDGFQNIGLHKTDRDISNLSSGTYVVKLIISNKESLIQKLLITP